MPSPDLPAAPARRPSDALPGPSSPAGGPSHGPRSSPASIPEDRPSGEPAEYGPEDFPGCESFHLPAAELDRYEGRLELWEARTETAWKVREPTTVYHERPARRLGRLAERIESLRGSRIESFGSADLARFDGAGNKQLLVQADEALYLHPRRSRVPGPVIDVDNDPLPDVVLEVDHTTDVRKRKLWIYQAWRFPEVWVLVPPESRMRAPGVEIRLLRGGRYRAAPESEAFPGWQAEEIYLALIEGPLSPRARPALERVARAMGAREGTRPEDDPITRSLNATARAEGVEQGRAEGIAEKRALLCRLAGRKFGAVTAGKLADRLAAVDEPERMAIVGEWIIDCATGEELLARLEGMA